MVEIIPPKLELFVFEGKSIKFDQPLMIHWYFYMRAYSVYATFWKKNTIPLWNKITSFFCKKGIHKSRHL